MGGMTPCYFLIKTIKLVHNVYSHDKGGLKYPQNDINSFLTKQDVTHSLQFSNDFVFATDMGMLPGLDCHTLWKEWTCCHFTGELQ